MWRCVFFLALAELTKSESLFHSFIHLFICPSFLSGQYREDGRCGADFLASDGRTAVCDAIPPFPTW